MSRHKTAVSSAGTYAGLTLTESYDPYGNRTNQVPTGSYGGPVPSASLLTFTGNNNRVDQWGYDTSGDVLNDGTNMYEYDAEGRQTGTYNTLTGLTGYIYDAESNRVMKVVVNGFGTQHPTTTVTKEYLLGPNGEQISVLDGNGNWQWTNVYAGGRQLASYDSAGTHFTLTDWLGTKRMQLGVTAASTVTVGEQCASLPYGDGLNCTGSDVNQLYFTGKQRDTESGNDYFLARYFSSDSGRFLTPDWSKNPQGVPYADYNNPQTLNLYGYVLNNPLTRDDPDGHSTLIYDGSTHTLILYSKSGEVLGQWHANNNVDSRASLGRLPNGAYPVLDQNSPHMHGNAVDTHDSNKQDSKNGEYGPGGIFRLQPFKGPDGKMHEGVGVHAGRENKPDAAGRSGPDHATQGCIRTCDVAVKKITDTAKTDPLTTVTVQNNRQPPQRPRRRASNEIDRSISGFGCLRAALRVTSLGGSSSTVQDRCREARARPSRCERL